MLSEDDLYEIIYQTVAIPYTCNNIVVTETEVCMVFLKWCIKSDNYTINKYAQVFPNQCTCICKINRTPTAQLSTVSYNIPYHWSI